MYDTAVVSKYLDTSTMKENPKFNKTTLLHDIVFSKYDDSTSAEQLELLSRDYKIIYRSRVLFIFFLQECICVLQYISWKSFHQIMLK